MSSDLSTREAIKEALGKEAVNYIQDGMVIGLGTGSTATCFLRALGVRCQEGLEVISVASSEGTFSVAKQYGIPVLPMEDISSLDITVDSADEVDVHFRLIKGGGGALLREKILASVSKKILILADESKYVDILGRFGLPIEILPFGYQAIINQINLAGYHGRLRRLSDGAPFLTDNGNYLYDIHSPVRFILPEEDHEKLIHIPGVLETGFFFKLPLELLLGHEDGTIEFLTRGS